MGAVKQWPIKILQSAFIFCLCSTQVQASDEIHYEKLGDKGAFIYQCKFKNDVTSTLIYPVNSNQFYLILRKGKTVEDISTIQAEQGKNIDIETNGGLAKYEAIGKIFEVSLRKKFTFVNQNEYSKVMERPGSEICALAYPL